MKKIALSLILLVATEINAAEAITPSIFYPPPTQRVDISTLEKFRNTALEMKFLVERRERQKFTNYFCIIGYELGDDRKTSVVYWPERNAFYIWDGSDEEGRFTDDYRNTGSLSMTKSYNAKTGVVDTEEELNGSTYLMLRRDVEATIADCQKNGKHYTIEPFTPTPVDE